MEHSKMMRQRVNPVDIQFTDLTYRVSVPKQKEKKYVLKGITGNFKAGELTAIMGPSGAGKSSLMNILTGFVTTGVNGTINFGGNSTKSRKSACYIMQDDFFYSWFTVEETMMLATSLKISNQSMSMKCKKMLIEHLLDTLRLSKTKQTKCGRLSGGQKKRLSIALELIDNPAVLFLDEPTTGLDSSSSFDTIRLLQVLASEGRTIVCTIHQPSTNIYNLFNHIYVMSQGHCTYSGTPLNTVEFLKSVSLECPAYHNPADFLLECVNGDYGDYTDALSSAAKNSKWLSDLSQSDEKDVSNAKLVKMSEKDAQLLKYSDFSMSSPLDSSKHIYPPPEWIKLWLIIGRCHIQFFRDWSVTYLKLASHIACGVLLGLLFTDSGMNAQKQFSNVASFMVHILYLWYTTMMPAVLRFPQEINIVKKETFNNWYKLRTYYLATLITSTPVHILFSSIYITILYIMTEQPLEIERYVKFLLVAVALTICADGMGVLMGTIFDPVNGTFFGSVLTCFILIFSGLLIFLTHMTSFMRAIASFSPMRYGLENMVIAVYANNRENLICPMDEMFCYFKSPKVIMNTFGIGHGSFTFNMLMIFLQLSIFKLLAYVTLRRKLNSTM